MEELLNPDKRLPKVTLINEPIIIDGPNFHGDERGFRLQVPAGIPSAIIGNLRHKEFVRDLVLAKTNPQALKDRYRPAYGAKTDEIASEIETILKELTVALAKESRVRHRQPSARSTSPSSSGCTATARWTWKTRATRSARACRHRTRRR